MNKNQPTFKNLTIITFLMILAAISQTLSLKANIGVCACWDSVGMNIYDLLGIKVGTVSIMLNCICVISQILILKKDFPFIKLFQVPLALISGCVINLMYYDIFTFEVTSYPARILLLLISYMGLAVFVGGMTMLDVITMPLESLCYTIDQKYGISFAKLRTGTDVLCITVSLLLSLIFGLSLKIREGTIIGLFMIGPLMGLCIKIERKLLNKYILNTSKKYE